MPAAWDANPVARAHAPAHNPGVATWRPLRLPRRNPQPTKDLRRQQRKSSVRCGWLQLCVVDPAPALRRSEQARTDFPGSGPGPVRAPWPPPASVWRTEVSHSVAGGQPGLLENPGARHSIQNRVRRGKGRLSPAELDVGDGTACASEAQWVC